VQIGIDGAMWTPARAALGRRRLTRLIPTGPRIARDDLAGVSRACLHIGIDGATLMAVCAAPGRRRLTGLI
jgi:hypothetical protein